MDMPDAVKDGLAGVASGTSDLSGRRPADVSARRHEVMISHAQEDRAIADAVCGSLEAQGIRCWIAPRDVRAGRLWKQEIIDAIGGCRVMVLIFSDVANRSDHVPSEVSLAAQARKTIIPLRIEDVMPAGTLQYDLAQVHWLDAFDPPRDARIGELVRNVSEALGKTGPAKTDAGSAVRTFGGGQVKVEQGIVGWDWDGRGYARRKFEVRFKDPFRAAPVVQTSIVMQDTYSTRDSTTRLWVEAREIHADGMTIEVGTWNENQIGGCKIQWLAIGE